MKDKKPSRLAVGLLTILEVACCLVVAFGVGLSFGPGAGLIVGGAAGVVVCERAAASLTKRGEKP